MKKRYEFTDRNTKAQLLRWSIETLADSNLDRILIMELLVVAQKSINRMGWRGNISDAWKEHSSLVTTQSVPDLFI